MKRMLLAFALMTVAVLGGETVAFADSADSLSLTPNQVVPGASVTVTAVFSSTQDDVHDVSVALPAGLRSSASWSNVTGSVRATCLVDTSPGTNAAACLWRARAGETFTLTAKLTVDASVVPGTYDLVAKTFPGHANSVHATLTINPRATASASASVTPSSVYPGETTTLTGTFTAQSAGDIKVGLYLPRKSGNVSFGSVTSSTGLTNCAPDGPQALVCTWQNAVVGQTRTLAAEVKVDPGVVTGATYKFHACSSLNTPVEQCAPTTLKVVVVPRSTLTLVKAVDNGTTGATHVASDWTLTAAGPGTVTGAANSAGVTSQAVTAGDYVLSESGPNGYTASAWQCTGAASLSGSTVTIDAGQDVRCVITNTARSSTLTLVKTVTNDNGGTAAATDWVLSAHGPGGTISGATGAAAVTDASLAIGDYDLAESGGPAGYTAGTWDCVGGSLTGSTITLALGEDVTCTILNDDQPGVSTGDGDHLAYTGNDPFPLVSAGLGMLIVGALVVAVSGGRRSAVRVRRYQ